MMSNEIQPTSIPPLLKGSLIFVGVSGIASLGYWRTPSGDLILPAEPTIGILSAFGALLLVWLGWTWHLWRVSSDSRIRKDFEHCKFSGASIHTKGSKKGVKVCTKCLYDSPAIPTPLTETPFGHHEWGCARCGWGYADPSISQSHKAIRDAARTIVEQ